MRTIHMIRNYINAITVVITLVSFMGISFWQLIQMDPWPLCDANNQDPSCFMWRNADCKTNQLSLNNGDGTYRCEDLLSCRRRAWDRYMSNFSNGREQQWCSNKDPQYDGGATIPEEWWYGIQCTTEMLSNGICSLHVYDMLGIRRGNPNTTPDEFVQDIVLTATTFIGTILTFALIVSALMIIFWGANENTAQRGRQGIKYALIGYVLVLCSYLIIRLVQYIAG